MNDPATCRHEHSQPVDVRDHTTGAVTTVARICTDCLEQLPANWGCPDCQWVEVSRLCDVVPQFLPGQPCPAHTNATIGGTA